MKLLLENWREYIAQEDSEQSETIEKLLQMEFSQAISLIDALRTDKSDNRLQDAYEMALGREYKDAEKELAYWSHRVDATQEDEDWGDYYEAKNKHRRLEATWEEMIEYFAEHDEL